MARRLTYYVSILSDYYKAAQLLSNNRVILFPPALLRLLISRFKVGIGPRFYMLFQFGGLPLSLWRTYLLDEGLRPLLRKINGELDRRVVDNKVIFHEHCMKEGIATVPILEKYRVDENGEVHKDEFPVRSGLLPDESMHIIADEFFCKRVSGSWGQGSFKFKKLDGQWVCEDKAVDLRDLCRQGDTVTPGEWIVQPLLPIHRQLAAITSSHGLSTVRIISLLDNGQVSLLVAMFRITVGDNVIDNFSAGQTGNLVAAINLETGRLERCKGSLSKEFPVIATFDNHPDTGNPVAGSTIPHWEDLKDLVIRAHQSLPQLVTLAWDVAVTDQGPVIIEANPTFDVSGMQVAHGRGLKPLLLGHLQRLRPEVFQSV